MLLRKIAAVLVLPLLFAACGGGDEESQATSPPAAAADTAQTSEDEMTEDEMAEDEAMDDEMTEDEMTDDEAMEDDMSDEHMPTTFTVTITNTSDTTDLETPLAPGAFAVHSSMDTFFAEGQADRGEGLEALAEDGDPSELIASLEATATVSSSGVFANPDDGAEPGPALPGSTYSFSFEAIPGDYLSLATMFVQSNDWFFSPASSGVNLFDGDVPLQGDISAIIALWDAGTEVDETPGEGPNQAPRQSGPNAGESQGTPITAVTGYDGAISVTIAAAG